MPVVKSSQEMVKMRDKVMDGSTNTVSGQHGRKGGRPACKGPN